LNCGVGLPNTVAVSCIQLPTAEQAPHYTLLCLIERQLVNHRDTRHVREINSGRAALRSVGIEWILRVRDSIAAADGAKDFAGVIDRLAPRIRGRSRQPVPAADSQLTLQAVVLRPGSVAVTNQI